MNRLPLLLTRPAPGNAALCEALGPSAARFEVLDCPLMEIVPLKVAQWPRPEDSVAFTSRNGVAVAPPGEGRRAWCVGEATAEAASAAGYEAIAAAGDVLSLLPIIEAPERGKLWHLHGTHRRGDLAQWLSERGIACESVPVYDQVARPLPAPVKARIATGEAMVAPLFSPRTAGLLAAEVKNLGAKLRVLALSEQVANVWPGPVEATARKPSLAAMVDIMGYTLG